MKVHKIILTVIDFDDIGEQVVKDALVNTRYPNDCISPDVISIETRDCGDWSDEHPLNNSKTAAKYLDLLFSDSGGSA